MNMIEKLRKALSTRAKASVTDKNLSKAAVLVPFFSKEGRYYVLFTKRSNMVAHHKGQVSFPGGARHEPDLSLKDTALREAWEEIGLDPKDVEILGELDDTLTTTSSFSVSPFVAFIPYPYEFKLSYDEIADIFDMPIDDLLSEGSVREGTYAIGDSVFPTYSYGYGDRVIWGVTAGILYQFLEMWKSASGAQL